MHGIHQEYLQTDGTDWNTKVLTKDTTYTSDPIRSHFSTGFACLIVTMTTTSNPTLAITYEVSVDKKNWYAPQDSDGTALNAVIAALAASGWIVLATQPAEWIRFKVTPSTANSTVAAQYGQQEMND